MRLLKWLEKLVKGYLQQEGTISASKDGEPLFWADYEYVGPPGEGVLDVGPVLMDRDAIDKHRLEREIDMNPAGGHYVEAGALVTWGARNRRFRP